MGPLLALVATVDGQLVDSSIHPKTAPPAPVGPETDSADPLDAGPYCCDWSEPLPDGRQRQAHVSLSTWSSAVPQRAAVLLYTTGEESLSTTSMSRTSIGGTDPMVFRLFMVSEKECNGLLKRSAGADSSPLVPPLGSIHHAHHQQHHRHLDQHPHHRS